MIALVASALLAVTNVTEEAVLTTNATPAELVASCRAMVPADVEISGKIVLRNRRGIPQATHDYTLVRSNGVTRLTVDGAPLAAPSDTPSSSTSSSTSTSTSTSTPTPTSILGTDVTWSDLTLEYLWWDDFSYDTERVMESVHGQDCLVVLLKKAARTVRVWVDRKTGAMMQAEELEDGKAVRRLWGTRIKKFGDRWAPNVLEVETLGSGHRTKITVESLK